MIGISFLRIGRHRLLSACLAVYVVFVLGKLWHSTEVSKPFLVPLPVDKNLDHFRRSRSLKNYIDAIQILIEPSTTACDGPEQVSVLVLVTSSPSRVDQRAVIRSTWAQHMPTYFVLGTESFGDGSFSDVYLEAKEYGDMLVFDFEDHYQNLTLKTALMLQWSARRCPQAEFLFKTDDDVFVNPWMLKQVLKDNRGAKVLGYMKNNSFLHRDAYNKWFVPRWLRREDHLQEYLSGTGYLISGEYTTKLLKAANEVPLLNLEDVYFTYLVAKKALGLNLTHDRRLSPYKPWIPFACSYFGLASAHSLSPEEMKIAWEKLVSIVRERDDCENYEYLCHDWFLY